MSIRITCVWIMVLGFSVYAWKDWFVSLCGLIVLTAVLDYPDMPHSLFGIQGLNLWNLLFAIVFLIWAVGRRSRGLVWDMPRHITILLFLYLFVILFGVLRAAFDMGADSNYPLSSLISEELINTVKWTIPGIILFDSCRTQRQVIIALICILAVYFLISVQVIKWIPPQSALGAGSQFMDAKRLKLDKEMGYHATDVSVMLAGGFWGLLAVMQLIRKKLHKLLILAIAGVIAFGQALTGGRGGYVAWGATGLLLCVLKWRKYLLLAPVLVMLLPVILPGATARMLEGFGQTDISGKTAVNEEAATSGRLFVWPYVVNEISKSPLIGFGRIAMKRTGLSDRVGVELQDDSWPHPHNMYLEVLLDNGVLGSLPILLFWALIIVYSTRLFRSGNQLCSAVGGLSLALAFSSLFAGISGQHVYPQEHTFGIWAALFLMLRIHVEEKRIGDIATNAWYGFSEFILVEDQTSTNTLHT